MPILLGLKTQYHEIFNRQFYQHLLPFCLLFTNKMLKILFWQIDPKSQKGKKSPNCTTYTVILVKQKIKLKSWPNKCFRLFSVAKRVFWQNLLFFTFLCKLLLLTYVNKMYENNISNAKKEKEIALKYFWAWDLYCISTVAYNHFCFKKSTKPCCTVYILRKEDVSSSIR